MPILKFQVAQAADSVLARDYIVNTLHFNVARPFGGKADGDQLCLDLANIFQTTWSASQREHRVRAYEVSPGPDGPPVGEAVINLGLAPASVIPREVALCLSYFAGVNTPRTRGRIFLNASIGLNGAGVRPNATALARALALVPKFAALGGVDVNWVVHSPTAQANPGVTNAWCDDEWDTVRSRGLRSTMRSTATTTG